MVQDSAESLILWVFTHRTGRGTSGTGVPPFPRQGMSLGSSAPFQVVLHRSSV